jgi:hypothetical protein
MLETPVAEDASTPVAEDASTTVERAALAEILAMAGTPGRKQHQ